MSAPGPATPGSNGKTPATQQPDDFDLGAFARSLGAGNSGARPIGSTGDRYSYRTPSGAMPTMQPPVTPRRRGFPRPRLVCLSDPQRLD